VTFFFFFRRYFLFVIELGPGKMIAVLNKKNILNSNKTKDFGADTYNVPELTDKELIDSLEDRPVVFLIFLSILLFFYAAINDIILIMECVAREWDKSSNI